MFTHYYIGLLYVNIDTLLSNEESFSLSIDTVVSGIFNIPSNTVTTTSVYPTSVRSKLNVDMVCTYSLL